MCYVQHFFRTIDLFYGLYCFIPFWQLHSAKQIWTIRCLQQHGHCASILFPRDLVEIIPVLRNKSGFTQYQTGHTLGPACHFICSYGPLLMETLLPWRWSWSSSRHEVALTHQHRKLGFYVFSPETSDNDPPWVAPAGQVKAEGPRGESLAPPTPPPPQESSHTWMELHLTQHPGSLAQPSRRKDNSISYENIVY